MVSYFSRGDPMTFARVRTIMISKPFATGVALVFFLFAGLYLGYQQGLEDGREAIRKIRLKPTANSIELLGTTEAELVEILQLLLPCHLT